MEITKEPTIGEQIYLARKRKGWHQKDLAEAAGTSQAYVSELERDAGSVGEKAIKKMSEALGVPIGKPHEWLSDPLQSLVVNVDDEVLAANAQLLSKKVLLESELASARRSIELLATALFEATNWNQQFIAGLEDGTSKMIQLQDDIDRACVLIDHHREYVKTQESGLRTIKWYPLEDE